jgi:hypothetical protein
MKLNTKQTESLNKLKKCYGAKNVGFPFPLLDDPTCAMVRVEKEGRWANLDLTEYVGENQPYCTTYRIESDGFIGC